MPIWLGGAGRSDADLARLLAETNAGQDRSFRNRRTHERHNLTDANGHLAYKGVKTPCQVLEISLGGCSVKLEKPWRPGVLAPVDLILPMFGMVLQISGITQWMKQECQIGVRFNHASFRSKNQLGGLISCISGESTPEAVREKFASAALNSSTGDVLAVCGLDPCADVKSSGTFHGKVPYDPLIHGGEGRLIAQKDTEWPAILRSPDDRFHLPGALADLSLGGCTIRTLEPFLGEVEDHVEVSFLLQGLNVQLSGVAKVIFDSQVIGVRFSALTSRRRDNLCEMLDELCFMSKTKLEYA